MDTFVESSWYFERYCSPRCETAMFDKEAVDYWMPVDQYIGGVEHAILHLLYSRYFTRVLHRWDWSASRSPLPGCSPRAWCARRPRPARRMAFFFPSRWWTVTMPANLPAMRQPVAVGRVEKMSKSKKNVIDPNVLLDQYGADTTRLFCLFAAPPERDLEWSAQGVEGSYRFLQRVWRLAERWLPLLS
jgi:leucyl-tRNA synthetase